MNIFSRKTDNYGRQPEVDLARGSTAVLIVIVHTGLFLGNNIDNGLWTFCDIAGSEFCAPVLMVLMGISMVYSRHNRPCELLKRGLQLFILGYALNVFRSLIPLLVLGNIDKWASVDAFFVVDILQFAGLAFMFTALLKKFSVPNIIILAISMVMVLIDQYIMLPGDVAWDSSLLTGLVNLFCPVSEWSCFPFLTWFVFPAFGLCFGTLLTHCVSKNRLYGILLPAGLCGVVYVYYQFYLLYPDYTAYYWGNNFYYMGLKNVLLTLLFVCFSLAFWFFAGKILPSAVKKLLGFLSRNLNTYFVLSWILISILIHLQALYGWQLGTWQIIWIMVVLIMACALLTMLWLSVKKRFADRKAVSTHNNS